LAGKIIHCGASATGQAAKLCNNMVLAVQQIAVGEAFVLAEKLGLPAQSLFDVITGATGNCWAVHTNCPVPGPVPTSPANNDFQPGFATALMNKDIGLAMDAVRPPSLSSRRRLRDGGGCGLRSVRRQRARSVRGAPGINRGEPSLLRE
jgi:3-hydroxyisobutyrate dehydrogenase